MSGFLVRLFALVLTLACPQLAVAEAPGETGAIGESTRLLVLLRQPPPHYRNDDSYAGSYGGGRSKASREAIGRRLAREHDIVFTGFWPMPQIGLDCLIMEAAPGRAVADLIAAVGRDRSVEWVEPVQSYRMMGSYSDPLFAAQPTANLWRLADLHRTATGNGVDIAVIDSSIDSTHPDLQGQVRVNRNFVDGRTLGQEAHGTGVAGIIAARANNGQGIVGVAPRANLLGLRACWQQELGGVCDSLSLAKALHYAIERDANVLNLSLSGPSGRLLSQLLDRAIANGAIVVAAVDPGDAEGGFPASHNGVVAVAETASETAVRGVYRAPGTAVPTTLPGARWSMVNGSSYAAAQVSGLFALLVELRGSGHGRPVLVRTQGGAIDAVASLEMAESAR